MADSYQIIEGQVVPYHGGRKSRDTDSWRDATPLELQLQEELQQAEQGNDTLRAQLEAAEARAEAAEAELSGIRRLVEIVGETESRTVGAAAMYLAARASDCNAGKIKTTMRGLTSAGKPIGDWDVTVQRSARTKEQQA